MNAPSTQIRIAAEQLRMVPIANLVPYANNAKKHPANQIAKLRASLREFGFVAPVLIDESNNILRGHGIIEAARAEGMACVPCVLITELSDAQRRAYIHADNKLAEMGEWDMDLVRIELEGLAQLDFPVAVTGFDLSILDEASVNGSGEEPAEALDLSDEPDPEKRKCFCPKCGFEFLL